MTGFLAKLRAGASYIITAITSIHMSPEWANSIYQIFAQLWQGAVPDPQIVPYLGRASNSRTVLYQSVVTNVICYAGIMFFYESCVRGSMRYLVPSMEDSYVEKYGMDLMVRTCLTARFFVDNAMLTMAVIKAGSLDNPESERSCDCEPVTKIQSKFADMIYQTGHRGVVMGLEQMYPILGIPLRATLFGRYFVEQSVGGMCTNHRNDILNRNNVYSFGFGMSFLTLQWTIDLAMYYAKLQTGIDVRYLNDALFYFFMHYLLVASLSNNKPLPGTVAGVDLAWPGRALTRTLVKKAISRIAREFEKPGGTVDWKTMQRALYHPYALTVERFFLGADVTSLDVFLRKRTTKVIFKLYYPTIHTALDRIMAWRDSLSLKVGPLQIRYNLFIDFVPTKYVPEYKRKVVNYVCDPRFVDYVQQIRNLIERVRLTQGFQDDTVVHEGEQALEFIQLQELEEQANTLTAAAAPPSMEGTLQRRPLAALSTPVLTPAFDAATVLKKIAGLQCWSEQGVSWLGARVPDGVLKIRAANADLSFLYAQIVDKFNSNTKRGLPAGMTNEFYSLIKKCYEARQDQLACKSLIDDFCSRYLALDQRRLVGLMPQPTLSQMGGMRH